MDAAAVQQCSCYPRIDDLRYYSYTAVAMSKSRERKKALVVASEAKIGGEVEGGDWGKADLDFFFFLVK